SVGDVGNARVGGEQRLAVNAGAATKLELLPLGATYESGAAIGAMGSPATVRILDAYDNLVSSATNSVTIAIGANPGSGTLSAVGGSGLTRAAVGGLVG